MMSGRHSSPRRAGKKLFPSSNTPYLYFAISPGTEESASVPGFCFLSSDYTQKICAKWVFTEIQKAKKQKRLSLSKKYLKKYYKNLQVLL